MLKRASIIKLCAFILLGVLFATGSLFAEEWISLGPEGGDARSLAYDPANPDRIFLGTSAGELFVSKNGGEVWSRQAHLGAGNDYVLDNIAIDPRDPRIVYVGAWSIENNGGDVFKSTDGGDTWTALPGIKGKSIRAMALSPSNSQVLAVGALDGVYRSQDAGGTWEKITPANHPELKNFESIAIDPKDSAVIYAGTWHLPWKTENGGQTWSNIKQGIIDDSDVFSIIVDQRNPMNVFVSACSGIYKSETAGKQFRKVQGIPFSARRTRVLQQDPQTATVVYAGTTEGLWKTKDYGTTWARVSPPTHIVNDVLVDPRNSQTVLLATDRNGVLMSRDGGNTFVASNRGFSHRQVMAVVADKSNPGRLYAALINNRELGGVFASSDNGGTWTQLHQGLGARDIFSLDQADSGALIAGTNQGIFAFDRQTGKWSPSNIRLTEKTKIVRVRKPRKGQPKTTIKREWVKGEIRGRVSEVRTITDRWFAATSQGLFRSLDSGKTWTGGPVLGHIDFFSVDGSGKTVFASTFRSVLLSADGGDTWTDLKLPPFVSRISSVALGPKSELWIQTNLGAFRSKDNGTTWDHVMTGQPLVNFSYVRYDRSGERLVGIAGARNMIFESRDGGDTWNLLSNTHYPIRNLAIDGSRVFAVTEFNGVVAQPRGGGEPVSASGGGR